MMQQISHIPGTTDLRIQQPFNLPKWTINVDRTRAQQVGYTQRDVASDVLTSLSGSFQTSPTFYLNPQNHVSYNIAVQTPQYDVQKPAAAAELPHRHQRLGAAAADSRQSGHPSMRGAEQGTVSHYNAQPIIDIYGSVEGTDLASVASRIEQDRERQHKQAAARDRDHSCAARFRPCTAPSWGWSSACCSPSSWSTL